MASSTDLASAVAARPTDAAQVVIQDIKQVPHGGTLSLEECPADWADQVAAIVHEQQAYLLVTVASQGSARMYEVRRRLKDRGYQKIEHRLCAPEVIRIVNGGGAAGAINTLRGDDATAVERQLSGLIDSAIEQGASDIHIETRGVHAEVYTRVNGVRVFHSSITIDAAKSIGVVLYTVHADASTKDISWDPNQVMDAAVEYATNGGHKVQLRFSSSPIFPSGNFHIVLRVLMLDAQTTKLLPDIGYEAEQLESIEAMLTGSSGMVIVCGPTNSGKSTTLQAMMRRLYERRGSTIKMITVEDPVEYVIPGACQIGVARRRRSGEDRNTSAFTSYLRGALRQDPDIVMVGEIRDRDSAEIVKDMVLTGRKVVTTLHTYSALWAFVRLREVGVPMNLLTMPGFVSGIIYQRLVPLVCPHCAVEYAHGCDQLDAALRARLQSVCDPSEIKLRGQGCPECKDTGIAGRTVVAEFAVPDTELLRLLGDEDFLGAEQHWRRQGQLAMPEGGVSALAHAIHKMRQGLFDPRDVEDQVGPLLSATAPAEVRL